MYNIFIYLCFIIKFKITKIYLNVFTHLDFLQHFRNRFFVLLCQNSFILYFYNFFCFQCLFCSICFWIIQAPNLHTYILNIILYRLKNLDIVEKPIIILQDLIILLFLALSSICKFYLASNKPTHWCCYYCHLGKSSFIKTLMKWRNHTLWEELLKWYKLI